MKNIKYTSDGKKVVVIGNLNAQEKIVQEIYIINKNEVPSGENFVSKDLHDAPAISWKEKKIKEIDLLYEKTNQERKEQLDKLEKTHREICLKFRNKIAYISNAIEKLDPEAFNLLADYITGEIKYIVITGHNSAEIKDIKDFNQNYDEKLRLISFFGKDDGSFTYAVGEYNDYSGGHQKFIPCRTKDEAIEVARKKLLAKDILQKYDLEMAEQYGIVLDKQKIKEYKSRTLESLNKSLKRCEEETEKIKERINEI